MSVLSLALELVGALILMTAPVWVPLAVVVLVLLTYGTSLVVRLKLFFCETHCT